jgi:hypothetical protein
MAKQAGKEDRGVLHGLVATRIDQFASEMRQLVYGNEGVPEWGTKFTEIEDVGVQIGDAVACKILEQSVARQADQPEAQACGCGVCGNALKNPDVHPHDVRSRRGHVAWCEPSGVCSRCRRVFFPSIQSVGN